MTLRAVYEITSALLLCLGAYIVLVRISTPRIKGTGWVSIAYFAGAIGMGFLSLRDLVPDFISGFMANLLLMLVNVFVYWGFAELMNLHRRRYWLLYISVLPELVAIYYFTYVHPVYGPRILVYNITSAFQYVLLAHLLWRNGGTRTKIPRYTIVVCYLLWAFVDLGRASLIHKSDIAIRGQLTTPIASIFPVLQIFTTVLTGLGFIWLAMTYLHNDLETQSRTDSLTGLLNRRGFAAVAAREIAVARRRNLPLSLVILDIDSFKSVNDLYGHEGGDVALCQTTFCLQKNLRAVDYIARLGGEEFVALLPETGEALALEIAERLRKSISGMRIQHGGREFGFSASFGVTTLAAEDTAWEALLHRGDRALYSAKRNGRNRVEAGALPVPPIISRLE